MFYKAKEMFDDARKYVNPETDPFDWDLVNGLSELAESLHGLEAKVERVEELLRQRRWPLAASVAGLILLGEAIFTPASARCFHQATLIQSKPSPEAPMLIWVHNRQMTLRGFIIDLLRPWKWRSLFAPPRG